jgi:FkbM family methyltransferase
LDENVLRPTLETLLNTFRRNQEIDREACSTLLGHSPSDGEVSAIRTQLEILPPASVDAVVTFTIDIVKRQGVAYEPLKQQRQAVNELFDAVRDDAALSLQCRSTFGAVSRWHELALKEAVKGWRLTRDQALAFTNNGRALTKHLSEGSRVCMPLEFRTVDSIGMPQVEHAVGEVQFDEPQRVGKSDRPFQLFVSNECELRQAAFAETDTVAWLEETISDDSVFWDVGANVGYFSLYAATMFPTVRAVCFEPSALTIARLYANVRLNGVQERVLAFPLAIGDLTGLRTFGMSYFVAGGWSHRGISDAPVDEVNRSVEQLAIDGTVTREQARTVQERNRQTFDAGCAIYTLDDVAKHAAFVQAPTHLKIDVDGPEIRVIRGARKCLRQPGLRHVLVEMRDDREVDEAVSIFAECGFRLTSPPIKGFGNRIFARDAKPMRTTRWWRRR